MSQQFESDVMDDLAADAQPTVADEMEDSLEAEGFEEGESYDEELGESMEDLGADLADVLTVRELQIAALLSRGRLNKQIASHLHISEYTVSTYLNRIFSKMGVHSRSAVAARYAAWISRSAVPPT